MNEIAIQEYRLKRLTEAVEKVSSGNRTVFGKKLGYKDGAFVRQMMSGDRAISEKTIRAIELLPGMQGWFSEESAATPVAPAQSLESLDLGNPDSAALPGGLKLNKQQIETFVEELRTAFASGRLTGERFSLLRGLLHEGTASGAQPITGQIKTRTRDGRGQADGGKRKGK